MKKRRIFWGALALCLMLTGCMGGMIQPPETLSDGTPWDGTWVNMAGRVGVEKPEGFDLLTTNGSLEDMTIQYATWVMGEETQVEKDTYVYEGQVYLMTELCESADQAARTAAEWREKMDQVTVTDRTTVTVDGAELELWHYDCTGTDSHFSRGITAVWTRGEIVLVADIARTDSLELDLEKTMTDFLAGFHYA